MQKNNKLVIMCVSVALLSLPSVKSATIWSGSGDGVYWDDPSNWSSGVPTSTVDAVIPDVVGGTLGLGGVDPGTDAAAKSITVQATSGAISFLPAGSEKLNLFGNFVNDSTNTVSIELDTNFSANSALDGPISFNGIANVDLRSISVAGTISFANNIVVQLNSLASYGKFSLGSGSTLALGGATILFSGISTYTGAGGDVFQIVNLSAGSWTGVTGSTLNVASLPVLTGGLSWNTASFTTNGSISVIPEPATWALLAGSLTTVMIFRRRRSKF